MKTFSFFRLLTIWLLLGQAALARRHGEGDFTSVLFKLAPPGALLAIGCNVALIGITAYAAKRSSGSNAESFATLAVLLVLPLLGLVVWYQPVLLALPVVVAGLYTEFGPKKGSVRERSSRED